MPETIEQARARRQAIRNTGRPVLGTSLLDVGTEQQTHAADLDVEHLVLDGMRRRFKKGAKRVRYEEIKVSIEDALLPGCTVERTIEGASTLTLVIDDPKWELLTSGVFDIDENNQLDTVDVKLDKLWFRLVKVNPVGDALTLTFEDREVNLLRGYDKPRSVSRKTKTRAQFIELMVREVKGTRIGFYSPQKNKRQNIGKAPKPKGSKGAKGLHRKQVIRIKGAKADAGQRRLIAQVMRVVDEDKADIPYKAKLALVIAYIVEQQFRNKASGDGTSVGGLQLTSIHGSVSSRMNIPKITHSFLHTGFTGRGGAIALARKHPGWSAGQIAQAVQGSGHPGRYSIYEGEGKAILKAWGEGGVGDDSASPARTKQYKFKRGDGGKREDSWTCMQRLASEVNWRCFMRDGDVWYATETWLLKNQPVVAVINRDTEGIDSDSFGFDWDSGKTVKSVSFDCDAERWSFPPASVIEVTDSGPADGRWLVAKVSRALQDPKTSITLKKASKPKTEPKAETVSAAGSSASSTGKGTVRDRIVAEAKKTLTSKTGFKRYSQAGRLTADPTPPAGARTDCSQWARAIYLKAGAKDPGTWTGAQNTRGKRTSRPKPGDLLMLPNHVEIYIGGGKCIGHGSAPIDYSSVDYWRGHWFVTYSFLD